MKLGNLDIKDIYVGSTPAAQVYFGDVKVWPEEQPQPVTNDWLCFTAQQPNSTVRLDKSSSSLSSVSLETSYDGSSWTDYSWANTTGDTLTLANAGDKVYMRAKNENLTFSVNYQNKFVFKMTGTIAASGNIQTLLKADGSRTDAPAYCYFYMFENCTSLTQAPALPATTLASVCYNGMFSGCTSLSAAPELPATTLADDCYTGMFQNCTSLSTPPKLSATTLATTCCQNMFLNCTSLSAAPELPATTLAAGCYSNMFSYCTSLSTPPELPATTLADYCYNSMFYGCTGLTNAGRIRTGNGYMYSNAYANMFEDCTNITAVSYPDAYESDLKTYIEDDQAGMRSTFENCDPSTIWVTYNGGADWLSAFMPQLEGVKFTATSPYTNISIQDVGNAANAGGICDVVYSTDGENWTNYTVGDTITLENTDDYVIFKAASESNSGIMSISSTEYFKFVVDSLPLVEGDLKYLYTTDPDNYYMTHDYQFTHLFDGCYFAIQYNGTYSSLTMPSQDNWIYSGVSYVFAYIFYNAQIARIKIPSSNNFNDWNASNSFYWWVAGIYTDGETGILTLPSFYSITYGESSIPNGWSYEQIS